jgi:hypothetical protein
MSPSRTRTAGVTAAATYAILCCTTALLLWGYVLLKLLSSPADDHGRHIYELYPVASLLVALVPPAVIAMGVRTAIGLLQLRPWARWVSTLWAAIALMLCLAIIAFHPFETFVVPAKFVNPVILTKQMIAISFVLMLLPVSLWWLLYFRSKHVKLQFQPEEQAQAPATEFPA